MNITTSHNREDIVAVNRRAARAKSGICIVELSSLSDLVPKEFAEDIRRELLANKLQVRQLTNLQTFGPWTAVANFVASCMRVRQIDTDMLSITTEMLIFDDTVALYKVEPEVSVTIIEDSSYAAMQRDLFNAVWERGTDLELASDGSVH